MAKATIIVLSDPKGGDEALGRMFNALAAVHDLKRRDRPVELVFQGAGTRWISVLEKSDHPAHVLYEAVKDTISGASAGCATLFGAISDVESARVPLLSDNPVPGTAGLPSVARFVADGPVLTF